MGDKIAVIAKRGAQGFGLRLQGRKIGQGLDSHGMRLSHQGGHIGGVRIAAAPPECGLHDMLSLNQVFTRGTKPCGRREPDPMGVLLSRGDDPVNLQDRTGLLQKRRLPFIFQRRLSEVRVKVRI